MEGKRMAVKQFAPHKTKFALFYGAVLLISPSFWGCTPVESPKECLEYYGKAATPREQEFREYDLEKQLTIHRCGLDRKPPNISHANYIADRGKAVVPALFQYLDNKSSKEGYEADMTKLAVVLVFRSLSVKGELNGEPKVVDKVKELISTIKTESVRDEANESLKIIIENTRNSALSG